MPKLGYFVILQKEQNFWNHSTFLKKHQILSRRLKESFSGNSVKISDCRAPAGHTATVTVLLDSTWDRNYSMGISVFFFSKLTFYINETFKIWVSLFSYHMLMWQSCQKPLELFIKSAFKKSVDLWISLILFYFRHSDLFF